MMTETPTPRPFGHLLHVLLAVAVYWAIVLTLQWLQVPQNGGLSIWGVQYALAATLITLTALAIGTLLIRQPQRLGALIVALFVLSWVTAPLFTTLAGPFQDTAEDYRRVLRLTLLGLLVPILLILWFFAGRGIAMLRGLPVVTCYAASQYLLLFHLPPSPLFYPAEGDYPADYTPVDVEALYHAQPALMQAQIAALPAQDPAKPEMFGLLLGGSSYQSVFLSEVEKGRAVLEQVYAAPGHFLQLANSDVTPQRFPMANRANLESALQALASHTGPEDMLFIYLTSHGSEDLFALSFYEAGTSDLTAPDFAAMLDRAKIGPAVIVLSACHSGSFIDELAAPNRLILTAAAADRTSFGCRDGNEWTDFGQAFVSESLIELADPRQAFARAQKVISQREFWQMLRHSLPQSSEGTAFAAALAPVLQALPPPSAD